MNNTTKILLIHLSLSIIVIITFLKSESVLVHFFSTYVFVFVPLVYICMGYKYVNEEDSKKQKLMNISVISLVGLVIWFFCFLLYLIDDINLRSERAAAPFVAPSEVVWLYYGMYNLYLFAGASIADEMDFLRPPFNKFLISSIIFAINFIPLFFMGIGYGIKKIIKRRT